mgnify:CR=1 FL=1|jgi:hypothetical protein|tara:strand:- start:393 stop:623 length:231 start_codon:yes stop_codon:yes gene_type:complete
MYFKVSHKDAEWEFPLCGLRLLEKYADFFPDVITGIECWEPLIGLLSHNHFGVKVSRLNRFIKNIERQCSTFSLKI